MLSKEMTLIFTTTLRDRPTIVFGVSTVTKNPTPLIIS
jgi:hypothetical protein